MTPTHSTPLAVARLEDRLTPATTDLFASGVGPGGRPLVQMYRADGNIRSEFFAFDPQFPGGVNVAYADVNADGVKDVVAAAGPGGGPHVKVFDGKSLENLFDPSQPHPAVVVPLTELYSFYAYAPNFGGGVSVAAADVDADGYADIVTGAGPGGGPHVKAFSGKTGAEIRSFYAFAPTFAGGVNVAAGRMTADAFADIVVGTGPGTAARVVAVDGRTGHEFFALTPFGGFAGGVNVALANLTGDVNEDLVVGAGAGGGPHVMTFDGYTLANLPVVLLPEGGLQPLASFFAFDAAFGGGVRVAATDLTADGLDEIITGAGPGGAPHVRAFRPNGQQVFDVAKFGYHPALPEYAAGVTVAG